MIDYLHKFGSLLLKLRDFFPTALPTGMAEQKAWADDIIRRYDIPDNDSMRWALAVMVLNTKVGFSATIEQKTSEASFYVSKRYFAMYLKKGMAMEIAGGVMKELKDKQQAEILAAKEKQKVEATTLSVVPSSGQQQ